MDKEDDSKLANLLWWMIVVLCILVSVLIVVDIAVIIWALATVPRTH